MKSFLSFRLDEINQCLWRGDTRVSLMPKPFAVLRYLVEHPGRLITHEEFLNAIWPETYVQPEVLRRYILEIRRVLNDEAGSPRFVETFPKRGYQFIATVTEAPAFDSVPSPAMKVTRLVGRESSLSELQGHLHEALEGRRQVVFVGGEPGIGKTSLVDEFQSITANGAGVRVARGQSVEGFGGKEAYYPIFEALGQLTRIDTESFVDMLASHAPTWLIQFPSLVKAEQRPVLEREIAGASRDRMVRELCETLEGFTATMGLVIILEDLHLADHSTLDLISAIARRREPAKLLVLGTFRPADLIVSESPLKALKHDLLIHRLSYEISLERLEETNVAEYIDREFGHGNLPREFAQVIHRHSEGNPLFMTSMLDHLAKNGVLSQVDGCWKMTVPLGQLDPGVPETLRHMLEMQLEHLSNEQQQLLKCASVAGKNFTAWSVATMMQSSHDEIERRCAAISEQQQFLKYIGLGELANGTISSEYEFQHSLYREVLYRRLNPTEQVNFHRLLGKGLETIQSATELGAAAEIALHFEVGREFEKAIRYLMVASENATHRLAHRESIAALEHARELLVRIPEDRRADVDVQLLEKIGDAYYALGELERSAATYHALATRAAEAGLLSAEANALMRLAHSAEAIPFFQRAIELDPTFASAYVSLSRIFSNLGEVERAKEYARKAYEQRDHVSERELLSILYQYDFEVTGDQLGASQALEVWKYSFPEEFQPANSLAYINNVLGNFERAVEEAKEAIRRNPNHGFPYSNLAHAYRGLGKFDEARKTAEEAVKRKIETLPTRRLLYQLAMLAGDEDEAKWHLEWGRDKPREFEFVAARAQIAACADKLDEARELYDQTAAMADARNLPEVGSNNLAAASWMELAFGNTERALAAARRVFARRPGYDPTLRAALTLAMCGCEDEAQVITDELTKAHPEHTIINSVLAPIVRAGIALAKGEPSQAISELQGVAQYELGFCAMLAPLYLRAEAYLQQGSRGQATQEFQRILNHRGSEPFSPFWAVAPLGLVRANEMAATATNSRGTH